MRYLRQFEYCLGRIRRRGSGERARNFWRVVRSVTRHQFYRTNFILKHTSDLLYDVQLFLKTMSCSRYKRTTWQLQLYGLMYSYIKYDIVSDLSLRTIKSLRHHVDWDVSNLFSPLIDPPYRLKVKTVLHFPIISTLYIFLIPRTCTTLKST